MTDLETILSWFQTGDMPTEEEFQQTFSSFRLKNTKIPIEEVDRLEALLNSKINVDDYIKDGKIRADKIEALGLTELIEASEKDISEFAENSEKYEFQQNDFIAIPDEDGSFSLYIFKGGEKNDKTNYLPTGLTNITIAMVEELEEVLNSKIQRPTSEGNYFANVDSDGNSSWRNILTTPNNLLFWDGTDFNASDLYRNPNNGKFGIGTTEPTEQLHLTDRARMSALILDENSENLPGQITRNENRFFGTNPSGIKRGFQYNDYEDYLALVTSLTDSQIDSIRSANLKSNESYSTGQPRIDVVSPFYIGNTKDYPQPIIAIGVNLYLNPTQTIVKLVKVENNIEVSEIDVSDSITTSQALPNQLCIFKNFFGWSGTYKIKITNSLGLTGQSTFMVTFTDRLTSLPMPTLSVDYDSNSSQTFLNFINGNTLSFNGTGGDLEKTLRIRGLGSLPNDYQHGLGIEMMLNVSNNMGPWENPSDYQLNFGLSSSISNNFNYDIGDRLNFQFWYDVFYRSLTIPATYSSVLSTKIEIYLKNGFWLMYYTSLGIVTSGSYSSLDELFLYFKLRNERLSGSLELLKIFKI